MLLLGPPGVRGTECREVDGLSTNTLESLVVDDHGMPDISSGCINRVHLRSSLPLASVIRFVLILGAVFRDMSRFVAIEALALLVREWRL